MSLERPIEVELKYRVGSASAGERLLNGETLGTFTADGAPRTSESEDRYIDTRDSLLAKAGYAARLRRERTTTTVSVKSLGMSTGSLQRRTEMEGPADRTLAPADWPHSPARSFILELCGDVPLVELVTVRQVRRKRIFRDGNTAVELSLDEVEVIARTQPIERFTELEVELVDGPEAPLLALRTLLDDDAALEPSTVSKLDAALAAVASRKGGRSPALRDVRPARRADRANGAERSGAATASGSASDGRRQAETEARSEGSRASGSTAAAPATGGSGTSGASERLDAASQSASSAGSGSPASSDTTPQSDASGSGSPESSDEQSGSQRSGNGVRETRGARGGRGSAASAAASEPSEDGTPSGEAATSATEGSPEPKQKQKAPAGDVAGLVVGKTPGVTADDIVAEAGRKVLRFHLARLIAREEGTRLGQDPEELHAMRVATRRMRAAWRVFGDGFRVEGTRRFRNRLRDVARRLGAVRDIDVLVIALEEYRAELPTNERAALQPLLDDWRAQREAARVVLMRDLDSDGYRRFVDDYRAFVLTPGAGALAVSPTEPHHVRDTGGSRIWRAYESVLAYAPLLRWADVPTLHQLRIAGKWLRYTLEFVAEALGPDAKPLIEKVVAMQDHLGLMNDAEVAAMKARALLVARSGTLTDAQTDAVARYLTSREREVARLKRGASAPWRALASPAFRRGLGRSVAALAATSASTTSG